MINLADKLTAKTVEGIVTESKEVKYTKNDVSKNRNTVADKLTDAVYHADTTTSASTTTFDPIVDTLHTTEQTLSATQKNTAKKNIGLPAGIDDEPTAGSKNLVTSDGVYQAVTEGVAKVIEDYKPINVFGNVENAPDEEDLTSVNVGGTDVLKFKDKPYSSATFSGMGRKYLRKNLVSGKNVLTSAMMSDTNTIYIIQYDFDLNGANVTIGANSILRFEGGSIQTSVAGGKLTGNNTGIDAGQVEIFHKGVSLAGTWNVAKIYDYWFDTSDYNSITSVFAFESQNYVITKDLNLGSSGNTLTIPNNSTLIFEGGSIDNGTVSGNNTTIVSQEDITKSYFKNVNILGTFVGADDKLDNTDGMGRIILRKDKTFAEQLTQENTIYVIRYDFELTEDVTIPANCVLEFEGGSLSGGSNYFEINLNNAPLEGEPKLISCEISNPYHKIVTNDDGTEEEVIEPATGEAYLDRTQNFDYKIEKDDLCYKLFIEKGFEWGGDWTDRKDYQHFELPTEVTEKYSEMYAEQVLSGDSE